MVVGVIYEVRGREGGRESSQEKLGRFKQLQGAQAAQSMANSAGKAHVARQKDVMHQFVLQFTQAGCRNAVAQAVSSVSGHCPCRELRYGVHLAGSQIIYVRQKRCRSPDRARKKPHGHPGFRLQRMPKHLLDCSREQLHQMGPAQPGSCYGMIQKG